MMKMATDEGSPLWQGAGTWSRLVFRGYRGLQRRNSRSNLCSGSFRSRRYIWVQEVHRWTEGGGARGRGAPPPGCALHPCGPLVAPLTYFFLLYMPIYPKTIGEHNRLGVPPPEASVATKSQSRPVPAPCRRGNPSPVAIFIILMLSMTRRV